jgi:hypothetical protein
MDGHIDPLAIIQPSTAQESIFKLESEGLDQMQPRADVGAKSHDIAGIGRDLRLKEYNVEHGLLFSGYVCGRIRGPLSGGRTVRFG